MLKFKANKRMKSFIPASNEPNILPQDAFGVLAWIFGDCREGRCVPVLLRASGTRLATTEPGGETTRLAPTGAKRRPLCASVAACRWHAFSNDRAGRRNHTFSADRSEA